MTILTYDEWQKFVINIIIDLVYPFRLGEPPDTESTRETGNPVPDSPLKLNDILPPSPMEYDKMAPPKEKGQATVVDFHVTVMTLDSIDESSMVSIILIKAFNMYYLLFVQLELEIIVF